MVKPLPKYNNVDSTILIKAGKKAEENTIQYYKDAKLLYENQSYGHSMALTVLGIEELGKAHVLILLGGLKIFPFLINHDGESKSEYTPEQLFKKALRSHEHKQIISLIFAHGYANTVISLIDARTSSKSMNGKGINIERFRESIGITQESIKNKMKDFEESLEKNNYFKNIDEQKLMGLYVDIKDNPVRITSPEYIQKEEIESSLGNLNSLLEISKIIFNIIYFLVDNEKKIKMDVGL